MKILKNFEFLTDKEKVLERWRKLGLLERLTDDVALKTALLMEEMARTYIEEDNIDIKEEYCYFFSQAIFAIIRHLCVNDGFKTFNCSKLYNIMQDSYINNTILLDNFKKNEIIKEMNEHIDKEAEIAVLICETLKKYPEIIDGVME